MARALALMLALFSSVAYADPAGDATAACAGLSLAQKISLQSGVGPLAGYSRNSPCAGVCGRTTFRWDNGPQGMGDGTRPGSTTQFPSSLSAAASFDPELVGRFGTAMGEEFWAKGTNIQEGASFSLRSDAALSFSPQDAAISCSPHFTSVHFLLYAPA